MRFIERLRTLDRLDQLIRMKATGPPNQLANRLEVSQRTVYNLVYDLKILGADVVYCKFRRSFVYTNQIQFDFNLVLPTGEQRQMKGGQRRVGWLRSGKRYFKYLFAVNLSPESHPGDFGHQVHL